jgi:hypothetical protein
VINATQLNVEAAAQMIVAAVKFLPLPEPSPEPTVNVA